MADDPAEDGSTSVDRLADRVDSIESKLDQLLSMGGKPEGGKPATQAERIGSVQEQVRAELERKAREDADAADKESAKAERQSTAERLAKLEEKAPVAPQPRRQRLMWGPR